MLYSDFVKLLPSLKTIPLTGQKSQFKLAPRSPKILLNAYKNRKKPKSASVLLLIYKKEDNKTYFLLTQRASYKGTHSAQISLTGGKIIKDETPLEAAIRETYEEVGVHINKKHIIRELTNIFIPPSNFMVNVFFACTDNLSGFNLNYEVDQLIEVNLDDLLEERCLKYKKIKTTYMDLKAVPYFDLEGKVVWGATAMILSEFKDLLTNSLDR